RRNKGAVVARCEAPPAGRVVTCRDDMGPTAAKRSPGRAAVRPRPAAGAERAPQGVDHGRRGQGYAFGASRPATGAAFTAPYDGRTTADGGAFLEQVEARVGAGAERVHAVLDNRGMPRALAVRRFARGHPRRAFVVPPTDAASLNRIEPWWKTVRSLAPTGRRVEPWEEVRAAVERAAADRNAHRHPLGWGRRRRRRGRRRTGIGHRPPAAGLAGCTT
ncbi:MAG: transposase, partial [Gemmatimonadota bacterium]